MEANGRVLCEITDASLCSDVISTKKDQFISSKDRLEQEKKRNRYEAEKRNSEEKDKGTSEIDRVLILKNEYGLKGAELHDVLRPEDASKINNSRKRQRVHRILNKSKSNAL
jgi:hypothetical protein